MEGKKSTVSADSAKAKPSIASELFGSKESSAPGTKGYSAGSGSSGIFDAVFSNPATMPGRPNSQFDGLGTWRKEDHQVWNSKPAPSDSIFQNSSSEGNKDRNPLFAGDHGKVEPCFLGSSLFYGGQDICNPPSNPSGTNKYYKDDDDRDERDCASRGNWWQESLYY
ncbi:hypothetical protein QJS04_geneDACA011382 [Acorus gramineus]|uniref:Uncharacterized protein n=1 Tax=Acorus gramineus TaxID=55184 RepID=A0AAV9AP86_ACOGR|nr:hypothetical protein QJS04_geneDACA011382 [Acorus gramineus]